MAVSMSWYVPGKVVLHKISGGMTGEDIDKMNRLVIDNKSTSSAMVHQLVDITEMTKPPSIGVMRQHARSSGDNDGYVVLVGNLNRVIQFTLSSIAQLTNFRIMSAPNVDDALMQLRRLDPTL